MFMPFCLLCLLVIELQACTIHMAGQISIQDGQIMTKYPHYAAVCMKLAAVFTDGLMQGSSRCISC